MNKGLARATGDIVGFSSEGDADECLAPTRRRPARDRVVATTPPWGLAT